MTLIYEISWICLIFNLKQKCTKRSNFKVLISEGYEQPGSLFQYLSFSYFEFKIRLIRLDLSFRKKFLYLKSQLNDSQSGVLTITPKSQLCVGDAEKLPIAFSYV